MKYVVVRRKSDDAIGTVLFQNSPRVYWSFQEDKPDGKKK